MPGEFEKFSIPFDQTCPPLSDPWQSVRQETFCQHQDIKCTNGNFCATPDSTGPEEMLIRDIYSRGLFDGEAISRYLNSPHHPFFHSYEYRTQWLRDELSLYYDRPLSITFHRGHWHETHAGEWVPHSFTVEIGNRRETFIHRTQL